MRASRAFYISRNWWIWCRIDRVVRCRSWRVGKTRWWWRCRKWGYAGLPINPSIYSMSRQRSHLQQSRSVHSKPVLTAQCKNVVFLFRSDSARREGASLRINFSGVERYVEWKPIRFKLEHLLAAHPYIWPTSISTTKTYTTLFHLHCHHHWTYYNTTACLTRYIRLAEFICANFSLPSFHLGPINSFNISELRIRASFDLLAFFPFPSFYLGF